MTNNHLKKKFFWANFLLIGSVLILTALTVILITSQDGNAYPSDSKHIALAAPSHIVNKKSKYDGIYMIIEKSADKRNPYTIQYPKTESKVFNDSVVDAVHKVRNQYLKKMDEVIHKDDTQVGNLTISYKTFVHKKNYYSFVLTQTTYYGTGSKQKSVKTFLYDQKKQKQVLLQDVIQSKKNLATLSKSTRLEMSKDFELKKLMKTSAIKKATEPFWINFENYSLTDKKLTVYFEGGQLSKSISSVKAVTVPLSSINSILAKPFKMATKKNIKKPVKPIALTFDDGPSKKLTPKVLKVLKKHHAKATFFMLGSEVNSYPQIAKQVQEAGHEIGNHSYSHPNLKNLTNTQVKNQLTRTSDAIKNATGYKPTLFRPPYGSIDNRIRSLTKLKATLWNVDTLDWKYRNSKKLLANVKRDAYPGSIVLMHDIHISTANGLDAVITYLEKQGYTFVTVSELAKIRK